MPDVDLSEFEQLSRPAKPPCKVGAALTSLAGAERGQLAAALDKDKSVITGSAIEQWLKRRDLVVTGSSITSHRQRRCSCHA
jgi:hypothetical protein